MRVVVTGGGGFIGRVAVGLLAGRGDEAKRELGFNPRPLEQGIAEAWGQAS